MYFRTAILTSHVLTTMFLTNLVAAVTVLLVFCLSDTVSAQTIPEPQVHIVRMTEYPLDSVRFVDAKEQRFLREIKWVNGRLFGWGQQSPGIAISRSDDTGKTWKIAYIPDFYDVVYNVTWSPDGSKCVIGYQNGTIVQSNDTGRTFARIPTPSTQTYRVSAVRNDGRITMARMPLSVLASTNDYGKSWHAEDLYDYGTSYRMNVRTMSYDDNDNLLFSFSGLDDNSENLFIKSRDNVWTQQSLPMPARHVARDIKGRTYLVPLYPDGEPEWLLSHLFMADSGSDDFKEQYRFNSIYLDQGPMRTVIPSPFTDVTVVVGPKALYFSVQGGPFTRDVRTGNSSFDGWRDVEWVTPTLLVGTTGRSIVHLELDPTTSVNDAPFTPYQPCRDDVELADPHRDVDVYDLLGRHIYRGPRTNIPSSSTARTLVVVDGCRASIVHQ